jgi:hypothetical protein
MQDEIVRKLGDELGRLLLRESQVLYIMAEIRKFIEREKDEGRAEYALLEFFCNWALHIRVDRPHNAANIRLFLQAFDFKDGMSLEEYLASKFFQDIMHLKVLKQQLQRFLRDRGLQSGLVDDHNWWSSFIYLYASIVSEVSMEYTKGDLLPDEVQELKLFRMEQKSTPQKMVRWHIKLKNGKEYNGSTLYGEYRNAANHIVRLPDFFYAEGFQV